MNLNELKNARYLDPRNKVLNPLRRDLAPEVGDKGFLTGLVKGYDAATRQGEAVVSSPSIDRHGEIVLPSAFDNEYLRRFMTNPVMLAHHEGSPWDTGEPTSIGKWTDIRVTGDEAPVIGAFELIPAQANDRLANAWAVRFEHGVQRAFSIGFIVHAWEIRELGEGDNAKRVRVFTKIELVEISAVHIPANYDAVLMAAGMDDGGEPDPVHTLLRAVDDAALDAVAERVAAKLNDTLDIDTAVDTALTKLLGDPDGPMVRCYINCLDAAADREDPNPDDQAEAPAPEGGGDAVEPGVSEATLRRLSELNAALKNKTHG